MMDLKQAIIIIDKVQADLETVRRIFGIGEPKPDTSLREIDGCLVPTVSDDYMFMCEEFDLCDYLADKARERFSDEYDLDFFKIFSFENIDRNFFEDAEKAIITALNLSDEEIEAAPVLIKRFI